MVDRAVRWFLQPDQTAPRRSDEEVAEEVARNYRWNFAVFLLEGAAFLFGFSIISASTILPLFVSRLTINPLALGLLAALAQGASLVPQLFVANGVQQSARQKPLVVNLGFFLNRLPIWLLVVAAMLAIRSPGWALIIFFLGYGWRGLGSGVVVLAWQELFARCVPVNRRGRLLGTTMFVGSGAGIAGSALSVWLLNSFGFPAHFAYAFAMAAAGITLSWLILALIREPVQPSNEPYQSNHQFWAGLPDIVRQDHNYRRFLLVRILMALGGMGMGFVTVTAVTRWSVPDGTVGVYTAMLLGGQTLANLVLGLLADRHGHKHPLEIGALASSLAFALAWLAPSPAWYYLVFFLLGITLGAIGVSGVLVVMEFCEPGKRPTYMGLANTGTGIASLLAPLLGAGLAAAGYSWLFALSTLMNLAALGLMHWWVQEPRWAETRRVGS